MTYSFNKGFQYSPSFSSVFGLHRPPPSEIYDYSAAECSTLFTGLSLRVSVLSYCTFTPSLLTRDTQHIVTKLFKKYGAAFEIQRWECAQHLCSTRPKTLSHRLAVSPAVELTAALLHIERIKAWRGGGGGSEAVVCFHRGVLSLGKCNRLEYQ